MLRFIVTILPIMVLLLAIPALASYDPVGMNQELLQEFSAKSQAASNVLHNKDSSEWTHSEIDEYLYCTSLAVYYSLNLYLLENDEHPNSAQELIDSGILETWPANPFNNWEPITWTPDSLDFSPGNLCVQLCPSDWYSRPNPPRPITYVISIFGPAKDYTPANRQETTPFETFDWAVVPKGSVYSQGFLKGAANRSDQSNTESVL